MHRFLKFIFFVIVELEINLKHMLKLIFKKHNLSLYQISGRSKILRYVASTPETRVIMNDPFLFGVEYTEKLKQANARILSELTSQKQGFLTSPDKTMVLYILRGGLNFGLREALYQAFSWNRQASSFISSQRVKDKAGDWHISENRYQKIFIPDLADIIFGDVVATGVSLEHALLKIVALAKQQQKALHSITFFTIGSPRAEEILQRVDLKCRKYFPCYAGSSIIYLEGRFGVAGKLNGAEQKLDIAIPGTDLLRSPALLTPEFLASQAEQLSYALERCVIYDAGSRAFHLEEYLNDVKEYWSQVLTLAQNGRTLTSYLEERLPEDPRLNDKAWVLKHDCADELIELAAQQLAK